LYAALRCSKIRDFSLALAQMSTAPIQNLFLENPIFM
jgi:hypothetical protein